MQPGRAPAWNVFSDLAPGSWLEAVELASGERLQLPLQLRRCLSWGSPKRNLGLLAGIRPDGAVAIAPLAARKDDLAAVRSAIDAQPEADRGDLVLAAMATYSQLSLQPDGRLRLPPILARHVGGDGRTVWIGAHGDELRLWSQADWNASLTRSADRLRHVLPARAIKGP